MDLEILLGNISGFISSSLIGFPLKKSFPFLKYIMLSSNDIKTFLTKGARILFVIPGIEFCSCIAVGILRIHPIRHTGPDVYPPTPTVRWGLKSLIMKSDWIELITTLKKARIICNKSLPNMPSTSIDLISNPAFKIMSLSIFLLPTIKRICTFSHLFFSSRAIAIPGNR